MSNNPDGLSIRFFSINHDNHVYERKLNFNYVEGFSRPKETNHELHFMDENWHYPTSHSNTLTAVAIAEGGETEVATNISSISPMSVFNNAADKVLESAICFDKSLKVSTTIASDSLSNDIVDIDNESKEVREVGALIVDLGIQHAKSNALMIELEKLLNSSSNLKLPNQTGTTNQLQTVLESCSSSDEDEDQFDDGSKSLHSNFFVCDNLAIYATRRRVSTSQVGPGSASSNINNKTKVNSTSNNNQNLNRQPQGKGSYVNSRSGPVNNTQPNQIISAKGEVGNVVGVSSSTNTNATITSTANNGNSKVSNAISNVSSTSVAASSSSSANAMSPGSGSATSSFGSLARNYANYASYATNIPLTKGNANNGGGNSNNSSGSLANTGSNDNNSLGLSLIPSTTPTSRASSVVMPSPSPPPPSSSSLPVSGFTTAASAGIASYPNARSKSSFSSAGISPFTVMANPPMPSSPVEAATGLSSKNNWMATNPSNLGSSEYSHPGNNMSSTSDNAKIPDPTLIHPSTTTASNGGQPPPSQQPQTRTDILSQPHRRVPRESRQSLTSGGGGDKIGGGGGATNGVSSSYSSYGASIPSAAAIATANGSNSKASVGGSGSSAAILDSKHLAAEAKAAALEKVDRGGGHNSALFGEDMELTAVITPSRRGHVLSGIVSSVTSTVNPSSENSTVVNAENSAMAISNTTATFSSPLPKSSVTSTAAISFPSAALSGGGGGVVGGAGAKNTGANMGNATVAAVTSTSIIAAGSAIASASSGHILPISNSALRIATTAASVHSPSSSNPAISIGDNPLSSGMPVTNSINGALYNVKSAPSFSQGTGGGGGIVNQFLNNNGGGGVTSHHSPSAHNSSAHNSSAHSPSTHGPSTQGHSAHNLSNHHHQRHHHHHHHHNNSNNSSINNSSGNKYVHGLMAPIVPDPRDYYPQMDEITDSTFVPPPPLLPSNDSRTGSGKSGPSGRDPSKMKRYFNKLEGGENGGSGKGVKEESKGIFQTLSQWSKLTSRPSASPNNQDSFFNNRSRRGAGGKEEGSFSRSGSRISSYTDDNDFDDEDEDEDEDEGYVADRVKGRRRDATAYDDSENEDFPMEQPWNCRQQSGLVLGRGGLRLADSELAGEGAREGGGERGGRKGKEDKRSASVSATYSLPSSSSSSTVNNPNKLPQHPRSQSSTEVAPPASSLGLKEPKGGALKTEERGNGSSKTVNLANRMSRSGVSNNSATTKSSSSNKGAGKKVNMRTISGNAPVMNGLGDRTMSGVNGGTLSARGKMGLDYASFSRSSNVAVSKAFVKNNKTMEGSFNFRRQLTTDPSVFHSAHGGLGGMYDDEDESEDELDDEEREEEEEQVETREVKKGLTGRFGNIISKFLQKPTEASSSSVASSSTLASKTATTLLHSMEKEVRIQPSLELARDRLGLKEGAGTGSHPPPFATKDDNIKNNLPGASNNMPGSLSRNDSLGSNQRALSTSSSFNNSVHAGVNQGGSFKIGSGMSKTQIYSLPLAPATMNNTTTNNVSPRNPSGRISSTGASTLPSIATLKVGVGIRDNSYFANNAEPNNGNNNDVNSVNTRSNNNFGNNPSSSNENQPNRPLQQRRFVSAVVSGPNSVGTEVDGSAADNAYNSSRDGIGDTYGMGTPFNAPNAPNYQNNNAFSNQRTKMNDASTMATATSTTSTTSTTSSDSLSNGTDANAPPSVLLPSFMPSPPTSMTPSRNATVSPTQATVFPRRMTLLQAGSGTAVVSCRGGVGIANPANGVSRTGSLNNTPSGDALNSSYGINVASSSQNMNTSSATMTIPPKVNTTIVPKSLANNFKNYAGYIPNVSITSSTPMPPKAPIPLVSKT